GGSRPDKGAPMTAFSPAELHALLRADFYSFLVRSFAELHAGQSFSPAWHAEVLAAKLQGVGEGRVKRLIVNVPPRHLKSLAASVALPAWLLGHDPTLSVVNVTYAQDLSEKFARDCRAVMTSPWYQSLFSTKLASSREPLAELATTSGGSRMATSVGGVLTGRGADVILIDDPLKPTDAMSESRRRAANDWFDSTLYSRLNDKAKGSIVIVMQRLHEDDLAGHVLRQGGWEVVSFPAIAEGDEHFAIETPFGPREFRRPAGEALAPEREPLATLSRIRATIGEMNFASQYQQAPAPAGGAMIKAAWFRRFDLNEIPSPPDSIRGFDRIIQSWDTANKPSELADYSVCTTWGLKGPNFYLLDVLRRKLSFPELKRAVIDEDRRFSPEAILIEDRASGTQLIQELIWAGCSRATRFSPSGDKVMRLHAQAATIENGFVFLPEEAPWLADYLAELLAFPAGRHDDQVDSTAQALAWAKQRPACTTGIIDYWRRLAEEG
ncbi:MAG: phage terminase large subunit, partial [Roseiarcus sp.]|uniref:phage terminase large subunit n=2 Tax=Roseiarcus sp. TaxID=1969460 RepID=UPI003BAE2AAE